MSDFISIYYLIALSFVVYFLVSYIYKIKRIHNLEAALKTENGISLINLKYIIGTLFFGLVFYANYPEYRFVVNTIPDFSIAVAISFIGILLVTSFLAYNAAKKNIQKLKPETYYAGKQRWVYFPIRIVFLLAYEFYFRGILFFYLLYTYNLSIAIIAVVLLYVLIHIFDSKTEILGAIPFGVALCLFSYFTNSIWLAFLIHITLSMVYEISLFRFITLRMQRA